MLNARMTKSEVEKELQGKGCFVQIDHLNRFLREPIGIEMKKFVYLKLAALYETGKLLSEAAKMYENAANVSIAFTEKITHHMKVAETYVKLGAFDRIDHAIKNAMGEANSREREEIQISLKQMLREQAKVLETGLKRNQAAKFYERLLDMRLSDQERREAKERLLDLYRKVGKLHEALTLEKSLG